MIFGEKCGIIFDVSFSVQSNTVEEQCTAQPESSTCTKADGKENPHRFKSQIISPAFTVRYLFKPFLFIIIQRVWGSVWGKKIKRCGEVGGQGKRRRRRVRGKRGTDTSRGQGANIETYIGTVLHGFASPLPLSSPYTLFLPTHLSFLPFPYTLFISSPLYTFSLPLPHLPYLRPLIPFPNP